MCKIKLKRVWKRLQNTRHVIRKEELEPKREKYCQNYANLSSERARQTGAKLYTEPKSSRAVTSKS